MNRAFFVVTALVLASPAAMADTLRCKSSLIQPGATSGYVAEKCGEPDSKETVTEPIMARNLNNGTVYQAGTTSKDIWRYRRAPGKFPAVLTFEQGILKKLEFEK